MSVCEGPRLTLCVLYPPTHYRIRLSSPVSPSVSTCNETCFHSIALLYRACLFFIQGTHPTHPCRTATVSTLNTYLIMYNRRRWWCRVH